jgi:hypothetical protein
MSGNHARKSVVELEAQGMIRADEDATTILDSASLAACCRFRPIPDRWAIS